MRKILLLSLLLSSSIVMGAEISGYVGKVQFTPEFADKAGLDEEAWTVDGRIDFDLQEYFSVEFGIGALFVDDKQKFTQEVNYIDYYDDYRGTYIAESSETGFLLSIAGKINYPMNDMFSGNMLIGYEYMDFDREIAECETCYSENVEIDAGLFLGAGIGVRFGENTELKFQYKMYLNDGDVDNQALIGIGFLL
ncbi:MAG: outer membrane beta-barrel protein [Candidatus Marithrix sp.]